MRLDYGFVPEPFKGNLQRCEVVRDHPALKQASDHFPLLTEIADKKKKKKKKKKKNLDPTPLHKESFAGLTAERNARTLFVSLPLGPSSPVNQHTWVNSVGCFDAAQFERGVG